MIHYTLYTQLRLFDGRVVGFAKMEFKFWSPNYFAVSIFLSLKYDIVHIRNHTLT